MTELICKGRMKHTDLESLFTGRIEDESILCTDSHKSYILFAQNLGVESCNRLDVGSIRKAYTIYST